MILNKGWFRKGQPSLNKGRTLESWVGEERAQQIRERMSSHSKKKAEFLRLLNANGEFIKRRAASRKFHDDIVRAIVDQLRADGRRCYILSEYVKEVRTPDAILFDEGKLVALEVEQEKRYKPSHTTLTERLTSLNKLAGFFDETRVFFASPSKPLSELVKDCLRELSQRIKAGP